MTRVFAAISAASGLAVLLALASPAAEARIVCRDGFQKSGGIWISTPYCNDADLARIARKHGVRVSDNEVRANPNKKYELCRFLSGDTTARTYCPDVGSRRGR